MDIYQFDCACCRTIFAPPEVWCARQLDDLKTLPLDYTKLWTERYDAASGPDDGVLIVDKLLKERLAGHEKQPTAPSGEASKEVNGNQESKNVDSLIYTQHSKQTHGISISLYDQNPVTLKRTGDPIADCYAYIARSDNAILVVADGVNWGERSRLAARCAVSAAINFLHTKIYVERVSLYTTKNALMLIRQAVDKAQELILKLEGGLTTLNITLVLPLADNSNYCVCSVNVGDSLTFVYSKRYGMNELSIGSHDINKERDVRSVGGALGPVNGVKPLLVNLAYSLTTCDISDIVFVTTDGISDNFDPVVIKLAVPGHSESDLVSIDKKAEMLPKERHLFSVKRMEMVLHEFELESEKEISAMEGCRALMRNVRQTTQARRDLIENPSIYGRKYTATERKTLEQSIKRQLRSLPGKLDHATIVAYEVGKGEQLL